MTMHVKVSGTWQTVDDPQVKVSGTWQPVQEGWVKVSGTWQQFYDRLSISLASISAGSISRSALTTAGSPVTATSGVELQSDGTLQTSEGAGTGTNWADKAAGQWASTEPDAGVGSGYEARLTVNSGSSPTGGSATASWLALSTPRNWTLGVTGEFTSAAGNWTLEIRIAGGGATVAAATFDVSADVSLI